jgi:rubrerythrin
MQATSLGHNRTGTVLAPAALQAMNDAADELTPVDVIDTHELDAQRQRFITEADAVGSVPPPDSVKGVLKTGLAKLMGGEPTVLMDKLGERLAFERTGTRLYDALIAKYQATLNAGNDPLLPVEPLAKTTDPTPESAGAALARIRAEELAHFKLLNKAILELGGDPTAQTPCADVTAVASMGIMQVLNDPRTTLAQCLNAMLTAELTDNAGWEVLIRLAEDAGQSDLASQFTKALIEESRHVDIIKTWLNSLLSSPSMAPLAV